jgi:hypothetical protein
MLWVVEHEAEGRQLRNKLLCFGADVVTGEFFKKKVRSKFVVH